MTATVTELPLRHPIFPPRAIRAQRKEALEELAGEVVTGTKPCAVRIAAEVRCFASASLDDQQAWGAWGNYVAEYKRWQGWSADDPDYRDLPGFYEEDMAAALDDLLDGTNRYHGDRR